MRNACFSITCAALELYGAAQVRFVVSDPLQHILTQIHYKGGSAVIVKKNRSRDFDGFTRFQHP
jgi:hypothetical protein